MSTSAPAVLFLANAPRLTKEWLPVAAVLREETPYVPLFALAQPCPQEVLDRLEQAGMAHCWIDGGRVPPDVRNGASQDSQPSPASRRPGLGRVAKGVLRRAPLAPWAQTWRSLRREVRKANNLLRSTQPSCVILMDDRIIGSETAVVLAANRRRVPTLLIPVGVPVLPGGLAHVRRRSPHFKSDFSLEPMLNRLVASLFPRWVQHASDWWGVNYPPTHPNADAGAMLMYPPRQALTAWALGIMPRNPWASGGGYAMRMAVESEQARVHFLAEGTPEPKMVVTGRPTHDIAYRQFQARPRARAEVCDDLGIDPQKNILVCSLPNLKEHGLLTDAAHWREMEFLLDTFRQLPDTVVALSLHPHCRYEEYRPVADQFGAVISRQHDIYHLVPVGDLFLAALGSATVSAAVGCGIPAVAVDFYGLGYHYLDHCDGAQVVRDRAALLPALQKVLPADAGRRLLGPQKPSPGASQWARFDGCCSSRVAAEIASLIKTSRRSHREA